MRKHSVLWFAAAAAILAAAAVTLGRAAADPAANMDWPVYRGDPKGNQYVPLAQIHAANVHRNGNVVWLRNRGVTYWKGAEGERIFQTIGNIRGLSRVREPPLSDPGPP